MQLADHILRVLLGASHEGETEFPHLLLANTYRQLTAVAREEFQDVVMALLSDLAQGETTLWNEAGDELLLLAEDVLLGAPRKEEAFGSLVAILGSDRPCTERPDLRLRTLGTLLGMKYRGTPDFWEAQHSSADIRYSYAVFEGLASIDVDRAFRWVAQLEIDMVPEVLAECLPNLLREIGTEPVLRSLRQIFGFLGQRARDSVQYALAYEGLALNVVAMDADFWIIRLGQFLQGEIAEEHLALLAERSELIYEAMETLLGRWKLSAYKDISYSTRFLKLIAWFPSPKAFAAAVTFFEIAIEIYPVYLNEAMRRLWRTLIEAFYQMRSIARQLMADDLGALQPVVMSYLNCLLRLMDSSEICLEAFEELVAIAGAREILIRAIRKAVLSSKIAARDCLGILSLHLGKHESEVLFGAI
jgi:hypothetical protein